MRWIFVVDCVRVTVTRLTSKTSRFTCQLLVRLSQLLVRVRPEMAWPCWLAEQKLRNRAALAARAQRLRANVAGAWPSRAHADPSHKCSFGTSSRRPEPVLR